MIIIGLGNCCQTAPWDHNKFYQIQTLVRMCMMSEKHLIGVGIGAQMIGLYLSTNGLPFNYKYSLMNKDVENKN